MICRNIDTAELLFTRVILHGEDDVYENTTIIRDLHILNSELQAACSDLKIMVTEQLMINTRTCSHLERTIKGKGKKTHKRKYKTKETNVSKSKHSKY